MKTEYFFLMLLCVCTMTSCSYDSTQKSSKENIPLDQPKQQIQIDYSMITPETAHPRAKRLLNEDFYWSPIEDTGPFGNDSGSDAFAGFREWRPLNPNSSPLDFFEELMISWDIPRFDVQELDPNKVKEFLSAKAKIDNSEQDIQMQHLKEYYKGMGKEIPDDTLKSIMNQVGDNINGDFLIMQDEAVIAIGFGQFVLEGKIDEDIQNLTKIAIRRELLPILLERFAPEYIDTRKDQLNKMLKVVDKMND